MIQIFFFSLNISHEYEYKKEINFSLSQLTLDNINV